VAAARAAAEAAAAALAAASTRLLPEWPLFGRLPPNAFRGLVSLCRPRKYIRGEVIIAQGEEGKSFYVLARGAVRVTRQTPDGQEIDLSRLHEGDFFGEMALIADTPRTATVTAERTVHLFEVEREGSEGLARVYPEIGRALADHCRGRLLKLLLASSPFFTQVAPEQRGELLGRFRPRVMGPGEPVMREGQPGEGLYVVASGRLRVDKIDADEPVRVATLGPGDFFGEISLLRGGGATATVTAIGQAVVLFLPRADFEQVAPDQPDLLAHIYRQSLARERENASILAAPGLRADDCLV
jgi:CRP-like cAMP-binding protein